MRAALVLLLLAGCRNTAFPACGPDGHPPSPTVENGTLFRNSSPSCPKTEPKVGEACSGVTSCEYAATQRGPCEFDGCDCNDGKWSCGIAME